MKAKDFYEQERVKGNTEDITGNTNPDYNNRFYSEIFDLMENFAIEAIKADREDAAEKAKSTIKCSETDYCPCYSSSDCYAKYASIDKSSITDRPLPTFKQ